MTAVPAPVDRLIGREQEIAAILALQATGRLLTITGTGGAGKTRLALEVARRQQSRFGDAISFVDLSGVHPESDLLPALADGLGLPGSDQHALALSWLLGGRPTLLVLDNCEHVIAAAARICADLVMRCPDLFILTTSREPLAVPGERVWPLEPLAVPPDQAGLEEVSASPAVQLFVDRARARRPGFALTESNAVLIAGLCRRMDGLPLAIVLSASRIGALTIEDLATRLEGASLLHTPGGRGGPTRHHTLEAAIDWSYALLSPDEQALFRLLGIFQGGATLAAIAAIHDHPATTDLLEGLVAKSLVTFRESRDGGRYSLLEAVRLYAARQLAEWGERDAAAAQHARYYWEWADDVGHRLTDRAQVRRLTDDLENLRAALRFFDASGEHDRALWMVRSLHQLWTLTGRISEGREWGDRFLPALSAQPPARRATLLLTFGALAILNYEVANAIAWLNEAGALFAEQHDPVNRALALNHLAVAYRRKAEPETMRALLEEAFALIDGGDQPFLSALLNANMMLAALGIGDPMLAEASFARALALSRAHGFGYLETLAMAHAVLLALAQADHALTHEYLRATLELCRENGADNLCFASLLVRAHLERLRGDRASCIATLQDAFALAGVQGVDEWLTFGLDMLIILTAPTRPETAASIAGLRERIARPFPTDICLNLSAELAAALSHINHTLGQARAARLRDRGRTGVGLPAIRDVLLRLEAEADESLSRTGGTADASHPSPSAPVEPTAGRLSPREAEVLRGVIAGLNTKEIARAHSLSARTVERHLQNIYRKIGARGRADAITWGLTHGYSR